MAPPVALPKLAPLLDFSADPPGVMWNRLRWKKPAGADAVQVFWTDDGTRPTLTSNPTLVLVADHPNGFWHQDLTPGTVYRYRARAVRLDTDGETVIDSGPTANAVASVPEAIPPNGASGVGMNPPAPSYYGTDVTFLNHAKRMRTFKPENLENGYGADFYPVDAGTPGDGQTASSLGYNAIQGRYPAGDYVMIFDGEFTPGDINLLFDASITDQTPGTPNRIEFQIAETTNSGLNLQIKATTNPSDRLRNFRIHRRDTVAFPGPDEETQYDAGRRVADEALTALKPFSVVRALGWGRVNANPIEDWSDRVLTTDWTYGADHAYGEEGFKKAGVAYEDMVAAAEDLGADLWVCIPHMATDAFVTSLLTLLESSLDASRHLYVEYSNEVWNTAYPYNVQGAYALDRANALAIPGSSNLQKKMRFVGHRTWEIAEIAATVFSGEESRISVVGAGHSNNAWTLRQLFEYVHPSAGGDAVYEHALVKVYSCSSYWGNRFNTDLTIAPASTSDADVAAAVAAFIPLLQAHLDNEFLQDYAPDTGLQSNKTLADGYGLTMAAYEGGPHLVDATKAAGVTPNGSPELAALMQATANDPRIYPLVRQALEAWDSLGDTGLAIGPQVYLGWLGPQDTGFPFGSAWYYDQPLSETPRLQALYDHVLAQQSGVSLEAARASQPDPLRGGPHLTVAQGGFPTS